jgi:hypothetical protein
MRHACVLRTQLADLLRQCWLADASKRPTMEQVRRRRARLACMRLCSAALSTRAPPQVVTRLSALKAWDTDGRLDKLQRASPPTEPLPQAVYNEAVVAAVRTGGKVKAGDTVRALEAAPLLRADPRLTRCACR